MGLFSSIFGKPNSREVEGYDKEIKSGLLPIEDRVENFAREVEAPYEAMYAEEKKQTARDYTRGKSKQAGLGYYAPRKDKVIQFGGIGGKGKFAKSGLASIVTDPETGEMYVQTHDFQETADKAGVAGSPAAKRVESAMAAAQQQKGGIGKPSMSSEGVLDVPSTDGLPSEAKRIMDTINTAAATLASGAPDALQGIKDYVSNELGAEFFPKVLEMAKTMVGDVKTKMAARGMEKEEIARRQARQGVMDTALSNAAAVVNAANDPFAGDEAELAALDSLDYSDPLADVDTFYEDMALTDPELERDLDWADFNYDNAKVAQAARQAQFMDKYGVPYDRDKLAELMQEGYDMEMPYRRKGLVGDVAGVGKEMGKIGAGAIDITGRAAGSAARDFVNVADPFLFGDRPTQYNVYQQPEETRGLDLGPASYEIPYDNARETTNAFVEGPAYDAVAGIVNSSPLRGIGEYEMPPELNKYQREIPPLPENPSNVEIQQYVEAKTEQAKMALAARLGRPLTPYEEGVAALAARDQIFPLKGRK